MKTKTLSLYGEGKICYWTRERGHIKRDILISYEERKIAHMYKEKDDTNHIKGTPKTEIDSQIDKEKKNRIKKQ